MRGPTRERKSAEQRETGALWGPGRAWSLEFSLLDGTYSAASIGCAPLDPLSLLPPLRDTLLAADTPPP